MIQFNFKINKLNDLDGILKNEQIQKSIKCSSILVQIYSARNISKWYQLLGEKIKNTIPSAVVIGASSVGEIIEGRISTNSTIVLFSFFEKSLLHLFSYNFEGRNEDAIGKFLVSDFESIAFEKKGVLLLSTTISNNSEKIFNILTSTGNNYPIFGGGAGDYANKRNTLVYNGEQCFQNGVVAVVFSGNDLQIELLTSLGWYPLSKEMTVTDIGNKLVKSIDGKPAFSVYEKYLGIKDDDNFFQNSLEFPFLIRRDGQLIARTPFFADENEGSIELLSDIGPGEKFRIGYGDPQTIIAESAQIQSQMQSFNPEAIFLYSCVCRRFLMQEDVNNETLPFEQIAPTSGFYTFGEFCFNDTFSSLLNSSMVAVGFREGTSSTKTNICQPISLKKNDCDPYINQHSRILSRLLYFINIMTNELEEQNLQLKLLNEQKNKVLGIAAHDLRNPTGAIFGLSELLGTKIDDEFKKYTDIITKESAKMLDLLNDLLDVSMIESGKLNLRKSNVDFIDFVMQNLKMNDFLAQNKGIQILREFEFSQQVLNIDEGKIEQVLNNLIGNAIKYSYSNSVITVKIFKENNQIITQIIDHGQGIPENEISAIFNPFNQSSVRPTSGETSHGLGLAIVKKIVEGHNGEVNVISEFGKGSIFYFKLPV